MPFGIVSGDQATQGQDVQLAIHPSTIRSASRNGTRPNIQTNIHPIQSIETNTIIKPQNKRALNSSPSKDNNLKLPSISPKNPQPTVSSPVFSRQNANTTNNPMIDGILPTISTTEVLPIRIQQTSFEAMICYNHYKKTFPVINGSLSETTIDAEYFLTFAYPNCRIHLTEYGPSDFSFEDEGLSTRPILSEKPAGMYGCSILYYS